MHETACCYLQRNAFCKTVSFPKYCYSQMHQSSSEAWLLLLEEMCTSRIHDTLSRCILSPALLRSAHNQPHAVLVLIVSLGGRKSLCLTWWWLFPSWSNAVHCIRQNTVLLLLDLVSKMLGVSMSCSFSIVWLATMLDVLLVKDKCESGWLGGLTFQHNCPSWHD
jgi:hypothetical protein